jgi:hypothetical protein
MLTKRSSVLAIPGFGGSEAAETCVSPIARYGRVHDAGPRGKSYRAPGENTGLEGKRYRASGEILPGFGGNSYRFFPANREFFIEPVRPLFEEC